MSHNGQSSQQSQVYVAQFFCRQCRYTSVDIAAIRDHVSSHMLEAATSNQTQRPTEQTRQLRERNLLLNPFRQILPSTAQPARRLPRSSSLQTQRSTQVSEASRPPIQTQMVQAVQHIATQQTQDTSTASLMPLIEQLDHPIPVIIDLDSDQNGDPNSCDLTLKL